MTDNTARLLINCPDAPGIVSAVSGFLYQHGANITDLDQHATAPIGGSYFMRLEFQTEQMTLSPEALSTAFQAQVAERYQMSWHISYAAQRTHMAILV